MDDIKILEELGERINRFTNSPAMLNWFMNEVKDSYIFDAGGQWSPDDLHNQQQLRFPSYVINKATPIIDAINGFQIQNRSRAKYQARMLSQEGFKDVVANTVAYIESDSNASFENSQAFRDMLVCGVGVTHSYLDYDNNEDGDVVVDRIFPGFYMWDIAARAKNHKDSDWKAIATLITDNAAKQILDEHGDSELPTYQTSNMISGIGAGWFMQFWDTFAYKGTRLNILWQYQWREKKPFYRVVNPFFEMNPQELQANPVLINYMGGVKESYGVDVGEPTLNMSIGDFRKFKKDMDFFGIELKKTKRSRYKYYHATILNDKVLDNKELFTQKGFSINTMTGRYDEAGQMYYGIMRALKSPQRLYNQAISDLQGLIHSSPLAGVNIEEDAVDNLSDFVNTYSSAKDVTIFKTGALSGGKVMPKAAAQTPTALADMIALADQNMMQVAGVNNEFMGIMDSGQMSGVLQAQRVRQALTTLAIFFDALKFYTIDQGKMFIDCVRMLVDIAPGRLIRNVIGEADAQYIPLLEDGVAAEYDIIVEDVPQTPGEKNEMFIRLMQIAQQMQAPQIYSIAMEFADIPKESKDKIMQALQPPPPPPPDPVQVSLLESQSALAFADADYKKSQAQQINMQTLLKQIELQNKQRFDETDISKTQSEIVLNLAKAHQTTKPNESKPQ